MTALGRKTVFTANWIYSATSVPDACVSLHVLDVAVAIVLASFCGVWCCKTNKLQQCFLACPPHHLSAGEDVLQYIAALLVFHLSNGLAPPPIPFCVPTSAGRNSSNAHLGRASWLDGFWMFSSYHIGLHSSSKEANARCPKRHSPDGSLCSRETRFSWQRSPVQSAFGPKGSMYIVTSS